MWLINSEHSHVPHYERMCTVIPTSLKEVRRCICPGSFFSPSLFSCFPWKKKCFSLQKPWEELATSFTTCHSQVFSRSPLRGHLNSLLTAIYFSVSLSELYTDACFIISLYLVAKKKANGTIFKHAIISFLFHCVLV